MFYFKINVISIFILKVLYKILRVFFLFLIKKLKEKIKWI